MIPIEGNIPLSQFSTFGIGGKASFFAKVKTIKEMQEALAYCYTQKIQFFILGKGSNSLFDDRGFKGMVLLNKISFLEIKDNCHFHVGAGYPFSQLGRVTARKNFTGLEFASGIPGTVGGAIYMNAGANGNETCEVLESVNFVSADGKLQQFQKNELSFKYRFSPFQKMKGAIVSATFQLQQNNSARKHQLEILLQRKLTQPYNEKSAGCIFRNPPSCPAGVLIEKCQLKGVSIGGAKVSEKHANFIINSKKASSKDILKLINTIQYKVKNETGVDLECEIKVIPYES